MSVRKRTWIAPDGTEKFAWVSEYGDQSGKRRRKTFARKKDADSFEAAIGPPEHKGRQGRSTAVARVARLAGLDDKDVRDRVMRNFERINAIVCGRLERRVAECRRDRGGEKRLGLDRPFCSGAEGGGLAGDGGTRGQRQCSQRE